MPVVLSNEFILARRSLSANTLVRNLRELSVLYRWLSVVVSVDKAPLEGVELPSNTETAKILRPFDKDIPPSGRG